MVPPARKTCTGQGLVEFVMIIALIAIAVFVAVKACVGDAGHTRSTSSQKALAQRHASQP